MRVSFAGHGVVEGEGITCRFHGWAGDGELSWSRPGYAEDVASVLGGDDISVEVDASDDTLGAKIRNAQTAKIPYTLVVGGNEAEQRTVAVRPYRGDQRKDVALDDFAAELRAEVAARQNPDD